MSSFKDQPKIPQCVFLKFDFVLLTLAFPHLPAHEELAAPLPCTPAGADRTLELGSSVSSKRSCACGREGAASGCTCVRDAVEGLKLLKFLFPRVRFEAVQISAFQDSLGLSEVWNLDIL